MPASRSLDALSRQWREDPGSAPAAALAEALRKRGELTTAAVVVLKGLSLRPDDLPALLVLSRIQLDRGDLAGARGSLGQARAIDPDHPVVVDALAALDAPPVAEPLPPAAEVRAPEPEPEGLLYTDDVDAEFDDGIPEAPLLSESLAQLYQQQGHLERASEVYRALLERDPGNTDLRSRHEQIASAAAAQRPRAYDAELSGGTSLRAWLSALAAVAPPPVPRATDYDAFYQPPAESQPAVPADFQSFQDWLKGLER
ncbi:MAG: tetratricopeptide repeat protein [Gemmatimonadota bacterium]